MKITENVPIVALFSLPYFYLVTKYPFSFNYEIEINNQYFLLSYATALFAGWAMLRWLRGRPVVPLEQILIGMISLIIGIAFFLPMYSTANEHFTVLCSIGLMTSLLVYSSVQAIKWIWAAVGCFYLWQLCLGMIQYFVLTGHDGHDEAGLTGSLRNSGIYSCYMVLHLPVIWFFLHHQMTRTRGVFRPANIFAFFIILTVLLLKANHSRTAMIALVVVAAGLLLPYVKKGLFRLCKRRYGKPIMVVAILWTVIILTIAAKYMIRSKPMSATGRMLLVEVAGQHISDHLWLGTGLGRFTWYYPQWQAQYFREHSAPSLNYYFSAGESYILFNEYLQLLEEVGVIGMLVFIASLVWFFRTRSIRNGKLLYMVKLVMCGLLACAFTSYPFHTTPLLFLFIFCLISAFVQNDKKNNLLPAGNPYSQIALFLTAASGVVIFILAFQGAMSLYKWNELRGDQRLDGTQQIRSYEALLPAFRTDGKFLTAYGEILMSVPAYSPRAAVILQQSKTYIISGRNIRSAATACQQIGDYPEAIDNYLFLSCYIPSRFSPRYEIAKLYLLSSDSLKAIQVARTIVAMPVKIPSDEVNGIKKDAMRIIRGLPLY